MSLHQPLHVLPGVGPKSAEKYAKLVEQEILQVFDS